MSEIEQAVRIGPHANACAIELADKFDLSRKAIVESAIAEFYERHRNEPEIMIRRVARESKAKYTTAKDAETKEGA